MREDLSSYVTVIYQIFKHSEIELVTEIQLIQANVNLKYAINKRNRTVCLQFRCLKANTLELISLIERP